MAVDTRDRILDAAERLIARLGYQKTTVDDIAAEAGVSKRTIYLYFPSKEEVVLTTVDRIAEHLKERLWTVARAERPPAARLREMLCERVMFRFDSVHDYRWGIGDSVRSLRPALLARRARHFDEEAKILAEVLTEGQAAGEFLAGDQLATAQAMILATNALLPASLSLPQLEDRAGIEAQALRVIDLLLGGVLTKDRPRVARRYSRAERRKSTVPS